MDKKIVYCKGNSKNPQNVFRCLEPHGAKDMFFCKGECENLLYFVENGYIKNTEPDSILGKYLIKYGEEIPSDYQFVKTIDDLCKLKPTTIGYELTSYGEIMETPPFTYEFNRRNVMSSFKLANSTRAMAQISQLMPYYGGEITQSEWGDMDIPKYCIIRTLNEIKMVSSDMYYFLAFHTQEQCEDFLKYNEDLVKQFYMLESTK